MATGIRGVSLIDSTVTIVIASLGSPWSLCWIRSELEDHLVDWFVEVILAKLR